MLKQPINQVRLTNVAIIRLKKQGLRFEVACYKNKILNWRSGTETDVNEVLQSDTIFENVSKGKLAKVQDLEKCFGTRDCCIISQLILKKGHLQISQKERDLANEATTKDIYTLVNDRLFNRRTGLPSTVSMVERALSSLGFSVTMEVAPKRQSLRAVELLLKEMPKEFARAQMVTTITTTIEHEVKAEEYIMGHCKALLLYKSFNEALNAEAPQAEALKAEVPNSEVPLGEAPKVDTSAQTVTIKFACNPAFFRDLDSFSGSLLPPAALQMISQREPIFNPNDNLEIPSPESAPVEPSTTTEEDPCKLNGTDEEVSLAREGGKSNEREKTVTEDKTMLCRSCNIFLVPGQEYRNHCRTEWHKFNVKRKFKSLSSISAAEFEELSEDIKLGFLAVDY